MWCGPSMSAVHRVQGVTANLYCTLIVHEYILECVVCCWSKPFGVAPDQAAELL
jgi:hypothetical protein